MPPLVAIVGSGRVAYALARALVASSAPADFVAARDLGAAALLAREVGVRRGSVPIAQVGRLATHVLVALSDAAVSEVLRHLSRCEVVLHTSGALGPLPIGGSAASGVLHPLQTFPDRNVEPDSMAGISFGYGGDAAAEAWALELTSRFGGNPVRVAPGKWAHYHAAAVMASNYQAALIDAALELMRMAGLSSEAGLAALRPLASTSFSNTFESGPADALTGPIRRGDGETVARHMEALREASPATRRFYAAAGLRTLELASLPREISSEIEGILQAGYYDGSGSD